jgi:hypothetical protein
MTGAEILPDVIGPGRADLSPDAAKSILKFGFSRRATARVRTLLKENNRGTLSAIERIELEKYLRVGQLVDLLQAKARLTLESRKAA